MTPEQYLEHLRQLMAEPREPGALVFAVRVELTVRPPLSLEQMDYVGGLLEAASMTVTMAEDASERPYSDRPRPGRPT
jgi:hypothetical protein